MVPKADSWPPEEGRAPHIPRDHLRHDTRRPEWGSCTQLPAQDEIRKEGIRGMAQIIIAKHRKGATGDVLLRFRGEFTRFANPEDSSFDRIPGPEGGEIRGSRLNGDEPLPPPPDDRPPF
ncbi:MAG: hypothetical protein J5942_03165 [Prevotella sp.]|nr:hypothetical protein [Prevotella sp.]